MWKLRYPFKEERTAVEALTKFVGVFAAITGILPQLILWAVFTLPARLMPGLKCCLPNIQNFFPQLPPPQICRHHQPARLPRRARRWCCCCCEIRGSPRPGIERSAWRVAASSHARVDVSVACVAIDSCDEVPFRRRPALSCGGPGMTVCRMWCLMVDQE